MAADAWPQFFEVPLCRYWREWDSKPRYGFQSRFAFYCPIFHAGPKGAGPNAARAHHRRVHAAQRVALVEEVKGKVTGVEFMDYVAPGTVIKLGPRDSIVLTYIKSCWRETITGGTVVIGVEQSLFHLSRVEGGKVDCDRVGRPVTDQQRDVAGTVFRRLSKTP